MPIRKMAGFGVFRPSVLVACAMLAAALGLGASALPQHPKLPPEPKAGQVDLAGWRFAHDGVWSRLADGRTWENVLRNPLVKRFRAQAALVTGLVLLTALSGTPETMRFRLWLIVTFFDFF